METKPRPEETLLLLPEGHCHSHLQTGSDASQVAQEAEAQDTMA